MMRKFCLALVFISALAPVGTSLAQVNERNALSKDTLNVPRDSMIHLIRIKDSLLHKMRKDSINMSNLISILEYDRDSLNAELNHNIYVQKLDSAERARRYISLREYNRRTRQDLYGPVGVIDDDSVRSSVKLMLDLVFEDTAFSPRPPVLKSSFDRLVYHLVNDSIFFRMVNLKKDTIPFILKKNMVDSAAFFVFNNKSDSAKIFLRSLDKNTMAIWVGDDLDLKHLLKKQGIPDGINVYWPNREKFRVARKSLPPSPPKYWNKLQIDPEFRINQVAFMNWAKGGSNNVSLTTELKAWANYGRGNIKWENYFWFVYGLQKTELQDLRRSQDRIQLTSSLSHKAFKNFDYTLGTAFETQGFKGFKYPNDSIPVSKFMSPADLKLNLGMTFSPNPKFTLNMYPVGGLLRFVTDTLLIDQTKYGLQRGKRMMAILGARVIIKHNMLLMKNVTMDNYLELWNNYIEHAGRINFDWRLSLSLKVNKYISTSIKTELMYDDKIIIPLYEVRDGKKVQVGEGKRVQFNEILGVSFKYLLY